MSHCCKPCVLRELKLRIDRDEPRESWRPRLVVMAWAHVAFVAEHPLPSRPPAQYVTSGPKQEYIYSRGTLEFLFSLLNEERGDKVAVVFDLLGQGRRSMDQWMERLPNKPNGFKRYYLDHALPVLSDQADAVLRAGVFHAALLEAGFDITLIPDRFPWAACNDALLMGARLEELNKLGSGNYVLVSGQRAFDYDPKGWHPSLQVQPTPATVG